MSLLRFLKQNPNTRKVFGKRELKIIEKQMLGVALTQSEKNRLSRDIRKKFEFISRVSRFENEFRLKKGAEIRKIVEEAKQVILNSPMHKRIRQIVLYGSAADNKLMLSSDIDIAVRFDSISMRSATLFRKRISGKVHNRIDIQVYNHLPDNIKRQVARGKVLYENTR